MEKIIHFWHTRMVAIIGLFWLFFSEAVFAQGNLTDPKKPVAPKKSEIDYFGLGGNIPKESISLPSEASDGIVGVLIFVQEVLLKVVLPIVAVGSMIYIAYELFTADGDSAKMKQAWSAVTYSIIALVTIMLSWVVVGMIAGLKL